MTSENRAPVQAPAFIWWLLWAGITAGLGMFYFILGRNAPPVAADSAEAVTYLFAGQLFVSCVVRWLVLPRMTLRRKALPVFIAGLAMADGCGLLAILLLQEHREAFVALAFLGLAQYAPVFVNRFEG